MDYPCFLMVAMPRTTSCNLSFRVFCRDSSLDLADSWKRNNFEKDENTKKVALIKIWEMPTSILDFSSPWQKQMPGLCSMIIDQEQIENSFAKSQI